MPACSRSGPATTPETLAPGAFFESAATSAQWLINGLNDDDDDDNDDDNGDNDKSALLNRSELLSLQSLLSMAFPPI